MSEARLVTGKYVRFLSEEKISGSFSRSLFFHCRTSSDVRL